MSPYPPSPTFPTPLERAVAVRFFNHCDENSLLSESLSSAFDTVDHELPAVRPSAPVLGRYRRNDLVPILPD